MKKIALKFIYIFVFFVITALFTNVVNAKTPMGDLTIIYTPNGTKVTAFKILYDLTNEQKLSKDSYRKMEFPEATMLRSSSKKYNCHSYAWYSQDESNNIWIDDPSPFYLDFSYEEVAKPVPCDIVCYFSNLGTTDKNDDINLHSGIIVGASGIGYNGVCNDVSKYMVESKWGDSGLFLHRGDYCPYVSTFGGEATYVRYFKRHSHTFDKYRYYNNMYHVKVCECGLSDNVLYPHIASKDNTKVCKICNSPLTEGIDIGIIESYNDVKNDKFKYDYNSIIHNRVYNLYKTMGGNI